jgi:hypothetical protein
MAGRYLQLSVGIPRAVTLGTASYDQLYTIGGTITAGTAITLPASQTYTNVELQVYLNGIFQEPSVDYSYVGSAPRTQVTFTIDLVTTDQLRFRILQ